MTTIRLFQDCIIVKSADPRHSVLIRARPGPHIISLKSSVGGKNIERFIVSTTLTLLDPHQTILSWLQFKPLTDLVLISIK